MHIIMIMSFLLFFWFIDIMFLLQNCEHNTMGDSCELCADGYHGYPTRGTPDDCRVCACPLTDSDNKYARRSLNYGQWMNELMTLFLNSMHILKFHKKSWNWYFPRCFKAPVCINVAKLKWPGILSLIFLPGKSMLKRPGILYLIFLPSSFVIADGVVNVL